MREKRVFVDELPRNAMGKVHKNLLRSDAVGFTPRAAARNLLKVKTFIGTQVALQEID